MNQPSTFLCLLAAFLLIPSLAIAQNRSYDGSLNNPNNPEWGAAQGEIYRAMTEGYADGISEPGMEDLTNPREISNFIFAQPQSVPDELEISDFGWAFGQFIDHDITLVKDMSDEIIDIPVPTGDPQFDPLNTGTQMISMRRSKYDLSTGTDISNPRVQVNDISAWIDASNIYGSDEDWANWLRSFADGKLKTSPGNMLPFNTTNGTFDAPVDPSAPEMVIEGAPVAVYFVSGDIRVNEQPILTALHTLFLREHNRYCNELLLANPDWSDEELYQAARKWVGAHIQSIAYNEWLPALGVTLAPYTGYDEDAYPNIMNVFSAAAFRLGHTQINGELLRLDGIGNTIPEGNMSLQAAFFNPSVLMNEGGIEPLFQGMATQVQQRFDTQVIDDLRNFLFGAPGAGGLDLAAININRGRERGLPDYNSIREDLGLTAMTTFAEISSDLDLQFKLELMYADVSGIDPWVGMLAEDHMSNAAIGETVYTILYDQFRQLRDGDYYYYSNDPAFSIDELEDIDNTLLSDIILRNSNIELIQDDVFHAVPFGELLSLTEESNENIGLYPNPSIGTVNLEAAENGRLRVYTMDGKLHAERSISRGQQSFVLNGGVYLVEFISDSGTRKTERVVILP